MRILLDAPLPDVKKAPPRAIDPPPVVETEAQAEARRAEYKKALARAQKKEASKDTPLAGRASTYLCVKAIEKKRITTPAPVSTERATGVDGKRYVRATGHLW